MSTDTRLKWVIKVLACYCLAKVVYCAFLIAANVSSATYRAHGWGDLVNEIILGVEALVFVVALVGLRRTVKWARLAFFVAVVLSLLIALNPIKVSVSVDGWGTTHVRLLPSVKYYIDEQVYLLPELALQLFGLVFLSLKRVRMIFGKHVRCRDP